jgi:hypothetical protein
MTETHNCKNCGNNFTGKFCNQCGEKVYTDHDKKLSHFFEEGLHFITHFDSKFLRTIRLIFFKPGFVSHDISNGVRKKYYKPLSLFLLGVVIYLLFPVLRGMNVHISSHLGQYRTMGIMWPQKWALAKIASQHLTEMQFVDMFEAKSAKISKLLLLIIIPLTGFWLKLLFYRKQKFFFDHFTLSAEINTFNLYLNFLLLPVFMNLMYLISWGNLDLDFGDNILISSILAIIMIWYITVALQRFYTVKTLHAFLKSLLFLAGHIIIAFFIYRIILFTIVMLLI